MAFYSIDIDDPEKSKLVRLLLKHWGYEETTRNHFVSKARAQAIEAEKQPRPQKASSKKEK